MERLTSNKPTSDMNMLELAYNSCYADEKCKAKYRDYELDIDSRELVKNLVKDMCDEDLSDMSDEEFDDYMGEMLAVEVDSQIGLLALFYRNLWAMADLREKLKEYEDIEEQGRLLKLPCKVGDTVYGISMGKIIKLAVNEISIFYMKGEKIINVKCQNDDMFRNYIETEFGKTVFLTKSEAEAKLKKLRGGND
nr:MAG TPA: hypothetical protein [Bacteriophage sp.]